MSIPLSNVVEMITLLGNTIERTPLEAAEPQDAPKEPAVEEAKPFRRRGRPRKDAS